MRNLLLVIKNKISYTEDKCKSCQVGSVYTLVYINVENNNKQKEFSGLCIRRRNKLGETFITLRNIIGDVGVEVSIGGCSMMLLAVKDTKIYKGIYNRNKLYYLRDKGINTSKI